MLVEHSATHEHWRGKLLVARNDRSFPHAPPSPPPLHPSSSRYHCAANHASQFLTQTWNLPKGHIQRERRFHAAPPRIRQPALFIQAPVRGIRPITTQRFSSNHESGDSSNHEPAVFVQSLIRGIRPIANQRHFVQSQIRGISSRTA